MNHFSLSRPVLAGCLGLLCLLLMAWAGISALDSRQATADHAQLIQQLADGTDLVVAESLSLLHHSQGLARIQQVNDRNIANYQLVSRGSVKRGLPSYDSLTGTPFEETTGKFADFQSGIGSLIQFRSTLERMQQGQEQLQQAAERMRIQADNIVDGLEQGTATLEHLQAAYRTQSLLLLHADNVRQAYARNLAAPELPLPKLREDLAVLSTAATAPASPPIRRSAANLLASLEEHAPQLQQIAEHQQTKMRVLDFQQQLLQLGHALKAQLDSAAGALYGTVVVSQYVVLMMAMATLGLAVWSGFLLGESQAGRTVAPATDVAPAATERTAPNFSNQLKTEKNQLMSDIKPIGDGILYIRADEHLESTGDLARCLNQSRDALVRRIEQLKRQAAELQEALIPPAAASAASVAMITTTPITESVTTDKSALIDLTLRGNAEMDGLQRRLRNLNLTDAEELRQLLIRCVRGERIFDEIRVRIKKGMSEAGVPMVTVQSLEAKGPASEKPAAPLHTLVEKLVANLEELQTQPPKPRKMRGV